MPRPALSVRGRRERLGVHDLMGNGWEWTSTVFERSRIPADALPAPADF
jgi:formylglycine-generating enzyme required for sulfatase activity